MNMFYKKEILRFYISKYKFISKEEFFNVDCWILLDSFQTMEGRFVFTPSTHHGFTGTESFMPFCLSTVIPWQHTISAV